MNRYLKHLFYLSLIGLVLLPAGIFATEMKFPNAIGEVIFLQGMVHAEQQGGEDRKLELGSQIIPKDKIITQDKSNIEIRFKDDTIYAQGESSSISLDDYVYSETPSQSKLLFKMGKGTFRFVTGEIVKQNPLAFELRTPLAVIGIRGTEPFAVVTKNQEKIGVIDIDPKHIVEISTKKTSVTIDKPGLMTSITPDGAMTPPAPTPAQTEQDVINSAPMTTKGELGSIGTNTDRQNKIAAFKNHVTNEKSKLSDLQDKPDYSQLHEVSLMQDKQNSAQTEHDTASASSSTSGVGGGGGGDGGGGDGGGGHY